MPLGRVSEVGNKPEVVPMKLALVTTTIHEPIVLRYLARMSTPAWSNVHFFIAGDLKSPHDEILKLCDQIGNAVYISPVEQQRWKCSEAIGWNCVQRRNIATLEALRWGATHIYSHDTDNIPMSRDHFSLLASGFDMFHGPMIQMQSPQGGWFDTGNLLQPPARQRGIPDGINPAWTVGAIADATIGVVAGACLGDPDISAVDRIATHPQVHGVTALAQAGVVIDPLAHTVFNSQNTAFVRELAPAMFMLPHVGRYDDIFASLICRRVMREHNYHLRFGAPFTWQERNDHNLLTDLKAEIFGMETIQRFATAVDNAKMRGEGSVAGMFNAIWLDPQVRSCFDACSQVIEAARLWAQDVEQAMSELPL